MALSGAWKRRATPVVVRQHHPPIDPGHMDVSADPSAVTRDETGAPPMPLEWSEGQYLQQPISTVYVDQTPSSPMFGLGALPGVDPAWAQEVAAQHRNLDLGSSDARRYERPRYREGVTAHAEIVSGDNRGDSPETVSFQREGVGGTNDPHARSNRRIVRWHDRPLDMHWYGVDPRPRYPRSAQGSREIPVDPRRDQYMTPYPSGQIMRPDNWATPIIRRSARGWDEAHTDDGQTGLPADYGLGQWGL